MTPEARSRIIANISNTRSMMLKRIAEGNNNPEFRMAHGDYALLMIAMAISNVAEVMLESEEVSKIVGIPDGEVPIVGRGN